ncbi:MAG: hypothetical protein HYW62_04825 [Candidatus Levybacteria bacterium]|nr:hypothetical protein [Candidatus Levybacteria bacterium]
MRFFRYYLLVLILSCLPFIGIFLTSLLPHTHDGLVHLARIGAYFKALSDGQIPVRWAGDLNYGYGMPLFNFMYHVPYIISSFFVFLGAGLVSAFKIALVLSFILSGIFMFGFSLSFFKDIKKAFLVTLFYQFFPFRLVEILIRGSFGEVYAYAFFPLVLWGIVLLSKKVNFKNISVTSLGTALLILSHNALSLVFFSICIIFILFFAGKPKNYIYPFFALFLGLLLAAFYWIPAIFEHNYTYGDLFMKDLYTTHFPPIQNFFIPNFLNNSVLQTGGISIQIGLFHTLVFALGIFALFSKKIAKFDKRLTIFCLCIFAGALFIMQPISIFLWEKISLLRQFQFSWRLLSVIGFATSLMAISIFYFGFFKKKIIYFSLLFLLIFSTFYYWKPVLGWDKIDEKYYWNFPLTTTYFGETDLIWSEGPAKKYPLHRVEVIDGKGVVSQLVKKSNILTFKTDNETPIKVVTHIQYFPGWRAFVDDKQVSIEFQYGIYRGHIVFEIPIGQHEVKLSFGESRIRFIADMLTVIGFVFLISVGFLLKYFKKT